VENSILSASTLLILLLTFRLALGAYNMLALSLNTLYVFSFKINNSPFVASIIIIVIIIHIIDGELRLRACAKFHSK
jgi:hypothetical protein